MHRRSGEEEQHDSQQQQHQQDQQQLALQNNGWLPQQCLPFELISPNYLDAQMMDATYVSADRSMCSSNTGFDGSPENLDNHAIDYFLTNFVVNCSGPSGGFMDHIDYALQQEAPESELLEIAVRPVRLACLANKAEDRAALKRAWAGYTAALMRMNVLLQRQEDALKDTTIFVMILLGHFVSVTCSDDNSLQLWATYVDRAINLLVNRENDQFKTGQGLLIFQEAISQLLHSCTYLQQPIAPRVRLLRLEATRFIPQKDECGTSATY